MALNEQKNDLRKDFIKHLLGHGGSYTNLIEIELVQSREAIMAHLPPPHQIRHVQLMEYIILYN